MNVPFIDFRPQYETIKTEMHKGLNAVFEKGNFILGEEAQDFEKDFARYCGCKHGVGVNSGTDALYLTVSALDIKPGDEVILPTFTFIATALCVSYTGAKPVFVDSEPETYNLDPDGVKKAMTSKTKAIIPVHIYGQAANMKEINALAAKRNIAVIEDACQAHGATYQGKKAGSLGQVGCFSFYPTKSLGGFGDGGMVVTNDQKIYEKVTMLRDYGRKNRYEHSIKGYNSRLDTVQAVVLAEKLKYLDEWNRLRNKVAERYFKGLGKLQGKVGLPKIKSDRSHVFQTFAVRLKKRDKIMEEMKKRGIGVLIHYPIALHLQEAYIDAGYKKGDLPFAEQLCEEVLSLPMFPHMSQEQVDYVCQTLAELV